MRKPSVYVLLVCLAVMVVFFALMERRSTTDNTPVEVCVKMQSIDV